MVADIKMGKQIIIIGAGFAGLLLGEMLSNKGYRVVLVEKEKFLGGLARTISHGNYFFHIGPHLFPSTLIKFFRDSEITPSIVHRHPPLVCWKKLKIGLPLDFFQLVGDNRIQVIGSIPTFFSFLGQSICTRDIFHIYKDSLDDLFLKFWKMPLNKISAGSADYARAKLFMRSFFILQRSRSNTQRIKALNYGRETIIDKLVQAIENNGGKVLSGTMLHSVRIRDNQIKETRLLHAGKLYSFECDCVVWTAPVTDLGSVLPELSKCNASLRYNTLLTLNYVVNRPQVMCNPVAYCLDVDVPFHRISEPKNINPNLAPKSSSSLCAEITLPRNETDINPIVNDATEWISHLFSLKKKEFRLLSAVKTHNAYAVPILRSDNVLEKIRTFLKNETSNLLLTGRTGTYRILDLLMVAESISELNQKICVTL